MEIDNNNQIMNISDKICKLIVNYVYEECCKQFISNNGNLDNLTFWLFKACCSNGKYS